MSTRDEVLAALRESADAPMSGETLARRLGVSRVAVGKHVSALRDAGYRIDAEAGSGYRLVSAPDAPIPTEVAPLVRSALWVRLEGGGHTASTNDDARALARAGAPEGTVVLASVQTGGRGRLGRRWESPEGGAYFSAVLRPEVAPAHVSSLALAVALGVARGLESLGVRPQVKWPNDVLVDGRKLAGVLLEMSADTDRVDWVVAGVGLNVRRPANSDDASRADHATEPAYVAELVNGARIPTVVAAALDGIADTYAEWARGGFAAIAEQYSARLSLVGEHVAVRSADGAIRAEGIVAGVDTEGRLRVLDEQGESAIAAGEVTLRRE